MHQNLLSIGFYPENEKKIQDLIRESEEQYTSHRVMSHDQDYDLCEFSREVAKNIGINVVGFLNEKEKFIREYYYPYFHGSGITSYADITVEKCIDNETFKGTCEEIKVNISLIFQIINSMDYKREANLGTISRQSMSVTLSGLADNGVILFPILKSQEEKRVEKENTQNRLMLLAAAQKGDTEAMENLTMEEMEMYTAISKRIVKEDIFTIVDTYIMPYGAQCDKYSIMGEIVSISKEINKFTKETIYILTLNVNELCFDICIAEDRLYGIPEVGRRFKGTIWMQGYLNF